MYLNNYVQMFHIVGKYANVELILNAQAQYT